MTPPVRLHGIRHHSQAVLRDCADVSAAKRLADQATMSEAFFAWGIEVNGLLAYIKDSSSGYAWVMATDENRARIVEMLPERLRALVPPLDHGGREPEAEAPSPPRSSAAPAPRHSRYYLVCRAVNRSRPDIPIMESSVPEGLDRAADLLNRFEVERCGFLAVREYRVVGADVDDIERMACLLAHMTDQPVPTERLYAALRTRAEASR